MKILETMDVGKVKLKNRLAFPAYETNWATKEGHVTPELVHLWRNIARGGTGLIVVQCTNVNPNLELRHTPFITSLHDDSYVDDYKRAIEEIKDEVPDVKLAIQLADKSIMARKITAADLSIEGIKQIIENFAQSARRSMEAGFDMVELHGAHNYTLAEFLSKKGNNRPANDPYGRTKERRFNMPREVVERARELVGDMPIIYRYSGDEFISGGNTLKDGMYYAQLLEQAGVDMLSVSAGGRREDGPDGYSPARCVPRADFEDACNVHLSERIKEVVSIPVMIAGKIGTVELSNKVLEQGKADLIAMARQLFCDPFTLMKTLDGHVEDINNCTWCRNCHKEYLAGRIALCKTKRWRRDYIPEKYRGNLA